MLLRKGEIWIITGRKGRLTIKLREDVNTEEDIFFDAELVSGEPQYLGHGRVPDEIGDPMSFCASTTQFVAKVAA